MPKEDWIKYHKPFKETCKENEIVHDDCNMHDPIPKNEVLYKHVNFCGVDRPCERPMIEEEKYCKQHKHERTITWVRDLNEIARELCDLYPFTYVIIFMAINNTIEMAILQSVFYSYGINI